jgi:hypothetical protein
MSNPPGADRPGGSWAVQGCLFGSVALFVVLLATMIVLAYSRFRAATAPPPAAPVPGSFQHPHPPAVAAGSVALAPPPALSRPPPRRRKSG